MLEGQYCLTTLGHAAVRTLLPLPLASGFGQLVRDLSLPFFFLPFCPENDLTPGPSPKDLRLTAQGGEGRRHFHAST
jgi:hypothetical protein